MSEVLLDLGSLSSWLFAKDKYENAVKMLSKRVKFRLISEQLFALCHAPARRGCNGFISLLLLALETLLIATCCSWWINSGFLCSLIIWLVRPISPMNCIAGKCFGSQEKAHSHQLGIVLREQEAEAERRAAEAEKTRQEFEARLAKLQVSEQAVLWVCAPLLVSNGFSCLLASKCLVMMYNV